MSDMHASLQQVTPTQLQRLGDARGALIVLESGTQIPFDIQRVYYVFGVPPGTTRGHHAHRELQQYAVAVAGSVSVLMDDGRKRWRMRLERPDHGLEIPPMVWHELDEFSADCVLLVLASDKYDERDYIRTRAEFERLAR